MSYPGLILNCFGETLLDGTDLALDGEGEGIQVIERSFRRKSEHMKQPHKQQRMVPCIDVGDGVKVFGVERIVILKHRMNTSDPTEENNPNAVLTIS